jgi:hypothetical protein
VETEDEAADEEAAVAEAVDLVPLAAVVVVADDPAEAVLLPQLSRMDLVQLLWPVEEPALAAVHSSAASIQMYWITC